MSTITVSNNRAVRIVHNPIVRNAGTTIATVERYAKKLNATFAIADVRGDGTPIRIGCSNMNIEGFVRSL